MPIFKLKEPDQQVKALHFLTDAIANKDTIKLENIVPKTVNQNSYLHLCLAVFALESGSPIEWVKVEIFKKVCNMDIFYREFVNTQTGEIIWYLRSWADVTKHEAITAIDRFIFYCVRLCPTLKTKNKSLKFGRILRKIKTFCKR